MKLLMFMGSFALLNVCQAGTLPSPEQSFPLLAYRCTFANADGSVVTQINVSPSDNLEDLAAAVISTNIINPNSHVGGAPFSGVYIGQFDDENATFKSTTAHSAIFINLGTKAHLTVTYENHKPVSLDGTCRNFQYESIGAHNK